MTLYGRFVTVWRRKSTQVVLAQILYTIECGWSYEAKRDDRMKIRNNRQGFVRTLHEMQNYLSRIQRESLDSSPVIPHTPEMAPLMDKQLARLITAQTQKGDPIPEA